jgi:hypothetical protein
MFSDFLRNSVGTDCPFRILLDNLSEDEILDKIDLYVAYRTKYYRLLLEGLDAPRIVVDNPEFITMGDVREEDIEWAHKQIEKHESLKDML